MRTVVRWLVILLALIGATASVVAVVAILAVRSAEPSRVTVHKGDYLLIDFDRGIAQHPPLDAFAALSQGRAYVLSDLVTALRRGAADPKVAGVAAHLGSAQMSPATAQELAEAIADFKKVGKKTLLYSESLDGGTGAVALATAFQEVWLQPSGVVGLRGLAVESPFLRKGLADYGIHAEIVQRYEYKSAMDFLTRDEMSPPVRENLQGLIDDIAASLNQTIARARGIDVATVRDLARLGPLLATEAKASKLVDRLGYRGAFQETVASAFPGKGIAAEAYAATIETPNTPTKIALVQAVGQIVAGETDDCPMSDHATVGAVTVARALREAARTKGVRATILRLNSPGGDYAASDTIRQAVGAARQSGVPVIVSMGDVAASGGYFIASAAETIIAEDTTITGSIGVIAGKIVLEDAWAKLGVRWHTLKTGETAAMWSPNRGFSAAQRSRLEAIVDAAYADFSAKVGTARKLSPEAVDKVARGRVFSGRVAKELGLVDDTGGLIKAIAYAKRAAGVPADQIAAIVAFPKPKTMSETLLGLFSGDGENAIAQLSAQAPLPEPIASLQAWMRLDLERGAAILPPITLR